jgi:hypothetical protein
MIVITKVLNPTDNLGMRIKAYTHTVCKTVAWDPSLNVLENHKVAAGVVYAVDHKNVAPEVKFIGQMPRNDGGYVVIFA